VTWKVRDILGQRIELVVRAVTGGESVTELSRDYGISRVTAHHWLKRYRETRSFAGLEDRPRTPHRIASRTPKWIVQRVLELRRSERWGGRKIRAVLNREGIRVSARTIDRILNREGCIELENRQRPALTRFERSKPNELWQMDFKGQYRSATGDCYPLSILDDHSRFAIGLYALRGTAWEPVRDSLIDAFQTYGLPEQMLMDHGTPWWGANSEHGLSQLSVMLIRQGIRLAYSGIGHPQTQRKVERFHRTLSESLRHQGVPETMPQWQPRLDRFRYTYNQLRPHEALMMKVPHDCYVRSSRPYCPTPEPWSCADPWKAVAVNSQGSIYYRNQRFFLSRALSNEVVAVREVEHTVLVRFHNVYVRELDLHSGDSRPLFTPASE
jgi:transposase InsO family protein